MITVTNAAALYPELGRLYAVMTQNGAPWLFRPVLIAEEIKGLFGVREWPDGSTDSFGIRSQTNARATRNDPLGELVWERTGTVGDVVDLVWEQLVNPTHPAAPRRAEPRVIAASGLFIPVPRPPRRPVHRRP